MWLALCAAHVAVASVLRTETLPVSVAPDVEQGHYLKNLNRLVDGRDAMLAKCGNTDGEATAKIEAVSTALAPLEGKIRALAELGWTLWGYERSREFFLQHCQSLPPRGTPAAQVAVQCTAAESMASFASQGVLLPLEEAVSAQRSDVLEALQRLWIEDSAAKEAAAKCGGASPVPSLDWRSPPQNDAELEAHAEPDRARESSPPQTDGDRAHVDALLAALDASDASAGTIAERVLGEGWKVGEKLGSGQFGTVYAAARTRGGATSVTGAVKLQEAPFKLRDDLAQWKSAVDAEEAATRLFGNSLSFTRLFEAGYARPEVGSWHYMFTELLDGEATVFTTPSQSFGFPQLLRFMEELVRGVDQMASEGVVHKDMKPQNILYTCPEGGLCDLKIVDFGISCRVGDVPRAMLPCKAGMEGSPFFLAPETLENVVPSPERDVWATGVVFYQLIFKERPIKAENVGALCFMIMKSDLENTIRWEDVHAKLPDATEAQAREITDVLRSMFRKDVKKRATAADVLGRLRKVRASLNTTDFDTTLERDLAALTADFDKNLNRDLAALEREHAWSLLESEARDRRASTARRKQELFRAARALSWVRAGEAVFDVGLFAEGSLARAVEAAAACATGRGRCPADGPAPTAQGLTMLQVAAGTTSPRTAAAMCAAQNAAVPPDLCVFILKAGSRPWEVVSLNHEITPADLLADVCTLPAAGAKPTSGVYQQLIAGVHGGTISVHVRFVHL